MKKSDIELRPKHRYNIVNGAPHHVDALCRQIEDEGGEIMSATVQMMPTMAPGGAASFMPLGFITVRYLRNFPETATEKEARAKAESRIITREGAL
jgi:hypothetical protein